MSSGFCLRSGRQKLPTTLIYTQLRIILRKIKNFISKSKSYNKISKRIDLKGFSKKNESSYNTKYALHFFVLLVSFSSLTIQNTHCVFLYCFDATYLSNGI